MVRAALNNRLAWLHVDDFLKLFFVNNQVWTNVFLETNKLATTESHSKTCSFTVLGGSTLSKNQSVSFVTTVCHAQGIS